MNGEEIFKIAYLLVVAWLTVCAIRADLGK